MKSIHISRNSQPTDGEIFVPGSKSESNRALIIAANSSENIRINNLSTARDTETMKRLLASSEEILDVLDAGTTMRFLLAHLAIKKRSSILTGTERMQERPVKILVDALRKIGGELEYLKNEGFPPVKISSFHSQKSDTISVRSDISSQYISALLMISPLLEEGLELQLEGETSSRPYIEMTLNLMEQARVKVERKENGYFTANQNYKNTEFNIEPDWSGASYWFSLVSIAKNLQLTIPGLKEDSFQGDSQIVEIMNYLGVKSTFSDYGLTIEPQPITSEYFEWDFSDCPDLFQTVAVCCAAKGIDGSFKGLKSLKIKETDRILALQNELSKLNSQLIEIDHENWELHSNGISTTKIEVNTYDDHRMAMAFAPLASQLDVYIDDASVVNKSYPEFWQELSGVGFSIEPIP